jgi:hypothetical protein
MIKTVLIAIFFGLIVTGEPDTFIWTVDHHKLQCSDFKAKPPKKKTKEKAMSFVGVQYDFKTKNDSLTITIDAIFDRALSWMKDKSFLGHEQGHFDVSEISARQFRKTIADLDGKINKKSIKLAIEIINDSIQITERENQSMYQTSCESDSLQVFLNKKIEEKLKSLDEYKDHQIKIVLKTE